MFLSALGRPDSLPALVVDFARSDAGVAVVSPALVAEYQDVALRSSSVRFHRKSSTEVETAIRHLVVGARTVGPARSELPAPDPDDQHLWDLLAAVPDAILVTGERRLREHPLPGRQVLSPREFVEQYLEPPVE